jgi:hypothetical protein
MALITANLNLALASWRRQEVDRARGKLGLTSKASEFEHSELSKVEQ